MAAEGVGIGRAALRQAADYANERESFGYPISTYQSISHPLASASALLSGAWLATLAEFAVTRLTLMKSQLYIGTYGLHRVAAVVR
jgi:alkylation response protein AidB-like acyl-CoA dehydrogenase